MTWHHKDSSYEVLGNLRLLEKYNYFPFCYLHDSIKNVPMYSISKIWLCFCSCSGSEITTTKNRWSQQTRQSNANATPQPFTISISVRQRSFFFKINIIVTCDTAVSPQIHLTSVSIVLVAQQEAAPGTISTICSEVRIGEDTLHFFTQHFFYSFNSSESFLRCRIYNRSVYKENAWF